MEVVNTNRNREKVSEKEGKTSHISGIAGWQFNSPREKLARIKLMPEAGFCLPP